MGTGRVRPHPLGVGFQVDHPGALIGPASGAADPRLLRRESLARSAHASAWVPAGG
jgi:hypothetical protein